MPECTSAFLGKKGRSNWPAKAWKRPNALSVGNWERGSRCGSCRSCLSSMTKASNTVPAWKPKYGRSRMNLKGAIRLIGKSKRILISTHVNPDPDALCSELALYYFLKSKGKEVTILNNDPVPERFLFLPGARTIKAYQPGRRYSYDLAVILD